MALTCPQWQNAVLHKVRRSKSLQSPGKGNKKSCHYITAIKDNCHGHLLLVLSVVVADILRNRSNRREMPLMKGQLILLKKTKTRPKNFLQCSSLMLRGQRRSSFFPSSLQFCISRSQRGELSVMEVTYYRPLHRPSTNATRKTVSSDQIQTKSSLGKQIGCHVKAK